MSERAEEIVKMRKHRSDVERRQYHIAERIKKLGKCSERRKARAALVACEQEIEMTNARIKAAREKSSLAELFIEHARTMLEASVFEQIRQAAHDEERCIRAEMRKG